jgi:ferredoxin
MTDWWAGLPNANTPPFESIAVVQIIDVPGLRGSFPLISYDCTASKGGCGQLLQEDSIEAVRRLTRYREAMCVRCGACGQRLDVRCPQEGLSLPTQQQVRSVVRTLEQRRKK